MSFTVIAPIFNEEKNVQILFDEILNSCSKIPLTQVIFVNDSSNDESLNQLKFSNSFWESSLVKKSFFYTNAFFPLKIKFFLTILSGQTFLPLIFRFYCAPSSP